MSSRITLSCLPSLSSRVWRGISSAIVTAGPATPLPVHRGRPDRSLRYREILKPLGFAHELGSVFADGSAWGGMDLIRGADVPDFTTAEVALVHRFAPHVGAGLKAAALRSRAVAGWDNPDVPGVLNLDRDGSIISLTPAAERWLGDLEDLHPAWRGGPTPTPVRMVAGALRRSPDPASGRDHDLFPRVRVRGRSGRWISLYASRAESLDGSPGGTVVVIELARPEDVAWLNVASYGLTPARKRWSGSSRAGAPRARSPPRSSSPSTRFSGTSRTPSRRSA